ncbi:MAG: formylglycine-generating enzyme family protein [Crocosphaera sp.]|uniref:formylglycine-generating enzyme family protein n=1 Tax=Crocosphaera sp. TaxID=2729996 RepID=UPI00258DEF41|nr:formylglycine-generating enzyme family protein [Crocosphaera sp.]MCH2247050.1 formylglycine-generating enzyme family protein [Crocosphaera sp.]
MAKFQIVSQPKQVQYIVEDLNGVPLQMILIPSGSFRMGAPETEEGSDNDERPQHDVNVSRFLMGRYPITQAQWKAVAGMGQVGKELKGNPSRYKGDKRPVTNVSWYDAIEFCARLSVHTKRNYRLPSEAEWEYACRAGTTTPFHFGETISTNVANYNGLDDENGAYGRGEKGEYRGETTEVDHFDAANAFGLSDMHGNVYEWCLDPWHSSYKDAPSDGWVWDEKNQQEDYYQDIVKNIEQLLTDERNRVLRGGYFLLNPRYCRSANRRIDNPRIDNNNDSLRVVCGLPRSS